MISNLIWLVSCETFSERETPAIVERKENIIFNKDGAIDSANPKDMEMEINDQVVSRYDHSAEEVLQDRALPANHTANYESAISPLDKGSERRHIMLEDSSDGDDTALTNEQLNAKSRDIRRKIHKPDTYDENYRDNSSFDNGTKELKVREDQKVEYSRNDDYRDYSKSNLDSTSDNIGSKNIEREEFESFSEMKNEGTPVSVMAENRGLGSGFLTSTPLDSANFVWPLKGKVIKRYSKDPSNRNDGINISAPLNTPVVAASTGEVVFAGNSGKYGKLVIIKHDNGFFTAYAHNSAIIVNKGDFVKKGDVISKVGKSGAIDMPQLYFSMKKNKVTINPEATQ